MEKDNKTESKVENKKDDLGNLEIFQEKFNSETKENEKINSCFLKPLRIQKYSKTRQNQYSELITSSFKIFFEGQVKFDTNYKIKYQDKIYSVIDCYNVLDKDSKIHHTEIEI